MHARRSCDSTGVDLRPCALGGGPPTGAAAGPPALRARAAFRRAGKEQRAFAANRPAPKDTRLEATMLNDPAGDSRLDPTRAQDRRGRGLHRLVQRLVEGPA